MEEFCFNNLEICVSTLLFRDGDYADAFISSMLPSLKRVFPNLHNKAHTEEREAPKPAERPGFAGRKQSNLTVYQTCCLNESKASLTPERV